MGSKKLSIGKECLMFEKQFAHYQKRRNCVMVNSGSSANLALIQALLNFNKIKKGDCVGFSALTWATNVMPLIKLGLNPAPIDISEKNLNVNSKNILNVLEKIQLKAFFVTNLLGFCGDLEEIKEICNKKGILLLEDNCESLGSELKETKLGNFGLASTFSFFVGHHLSTIEGGMVCTDDEEIYEMLKMVRAHGWSRDLHTEKRNKLRTKHNVDEFFDLYTFYTLGFNIRPTEITGFLGLEQLNYIEDIVKKRKNNFEIFHKVAKENPAFLALDVSHMNSVSNFAYPLIFKNRESFEKYKKKFSEFVEIRPIVGGSMVEQPFFKKYAEEKGIFYDCPVAKKIHEFGFYFPNNPDLTGEEINSIIELLKTK